MARLSKTKDKRYVIKNHGSEKNGRLYDKKGIIKYIHTEVKHKGKIIEPDESVDNEIINILNTARIFYCSKHHNYSLEEVAELATQALKDLEKYQ